MAYCPECGSQVAEIDVFCPFCGISLKPFGAASVEEESQTDTVTINQPEISDTSTDVAFRSKEEAAEKVETIEKPEDAVSESGAKDAEAKKSADSATASSLNNRTAANFGWKTESVDVPSDIFGNQSSVRETALTEDKPAIEENKTEAESSGSAGAAENAEESKFEPEAAAQEPSISAASEQKSIEIIEPIQETPVFDGERENVSEADEPRDESSLEEYGETKAAEIDASGKIEETPTEVEDTPDVSDEAENEFIEESDFSPENDSFSSANEYDYADAVSAQNESDEESFSDAASENQETPDSPENQDFSVAEPIAKPELELPAETASGASVFDSVQIVQKDKKYEKAIEEESVESDENQAKHQDAPQKESRSYTSPNMNTGGGTDGKSSAKLKPLEEGTVLNGRYEIVRKIGGGGMGAVYLASDKNLGGVLRAVKEMVQSYIEETQQEKAVSDFKRESMLLTSLDHQAIPTIYDYFYDEREARFYLVMKYISGGDLASRLRSTNEGRIDEKSVTEWAIQIADVLDYLHNRQPPIVYRDLKPANIMVDGNTGRVMLIDFGIARWINKEEKGVTAVGTMGYAPPELFSGNVEPRSDIYSLGSTMFHLLTGADPQSNPLLIFDFQKNPHPRQINPQMSDQMERILMRSVEYNAEKRFASAAEMRQDLEEHLANLKANKITFGVKETPVSHGLSEEPVFCGFCGQKIIATDMFCAFCGARQPMSQPGVHQQSPTGFKPQPLTAKLTIVGTNELESPTFSLEKDENLVGRRDPMSNIFPEVDLSKFDPQTKISRRHARIWRNGSQYMVEDLGSSNGTVLLPVRADAVRLTPNQSYVLTSGDKLKLGDTTMHFIVG